MPAISLDTLTADAIILSQAPVGLRFLADCLLEAEREHREHGSGDEGDVCTCRRPRVIRFSTATVQEESAAGLRAF